MLLGLFIDVKKLVCFHNYRPNCNNFRVLSKPLIYQSSESESELSSPELSGFLGFRMAFIASRNASPGLSPPSSGAGFSVTTFLLSLSQLPFPKTTPLRSLASKSNPFPPVFFGGGAGALAAEGENLVAAGKPGPGGGGGGGGGGPPTAGRGGGGAGGAPLRPLSSGEIPPCPLGAP